MNELKVHNLKIPIHLDSLTTYYIRDVRFIILLNPPTHLGKLDYHYFWPYFAHEEVRAFGGIHLPANEVVGDENQTCRLAANTAMDRFAAIHSDF